MAKDVTTFLNWAAEPEHDERKKIGLQAMIIFSTLLTLSLYTKRFKWTPLKTRKIGTFRISCASDRADPFRLLPFYSLCSTKRRSLECG